MTSFVARRLFLAWMGLLFLAVSASCASIPAAEVYPTSEDGFYLIPFESTVRQVTFQSEDGVTLAGQMDFPIGVENPPLVFIIHHSGPVDRDAYQYLAALLVPQGYAVFRFDKRGNGQSAGVYGCCEDADALAAFRAATAQEGFRNENVFILAQSIGTRILAQRYNRFVNVHPVRGTILLSSLLEGKEILNIESDLFIIVSDREDHLAAITEEAVAVHREEYGGDASYYVAPQTEHTLFDISEAPIDWSDPKWPLKFSTQAGDQLLAWLDAHH